MQDLEHTTDMDRLDNENPWPGLRAFTEDNANFFFGREREIQDLARKVRHETLTVLFGKSGLGKTSLLQAGLSPVLRTLGLLPVYIRLNHFEETMPLKEQVDVFIREVMDAEHIDGPRPVQEESLWELFHKKNGEWWDEENRLLKPVLIFDQFEEILTAGQANPLRAARTEAFLSELEDLIENRPPDDLLQRFKEQKGLAKQYDFGRMDYRVILSLREDYLADLEGLHERLRTIMHNRYRLLQLNGKQAMDVVLKPGRHLVDDSVAATIVDFVASTARPTLGGAEDGQDSRQVEPALLSIILRELNNHRIRSGQDQISADLVKDKRPETILSEFYEQSLEDVGKKARRFIEEQLLTASGARNRVAEGDAVDRYGVPAEVIETLINRRVLQREKTDRLSWLELSHDTLTQVVRSSAERFRMVQRRRQYLSRSAIVLLCLSALGFAFYSWQRHERILQTEEAAKLSLDIASNLENNYTISLAGKQRIIQRLDENFKHLRKSAGDLADLRERNIRFLLVSASMQFDGGYVQNALDLLGEARQQLFDEKTDKLRFEAPDMLLARFYIVKAEIETLLGSSQNALDFLKTAKGYFPPAQASDPNAAMQWQELYMKWLGDKATLEGMRGNWKELDNLCLLARTLVKEILAEEGKAQSPDSDLSDAAIIHKQNLYNGLFKTYIAKIDFENSYSSVSDNTITEFEENLQTAKKYFKNDAYRRWKYYYAYKALAISNNLIINSEEDSRKELATAIKDIADLVQKNPDNLFYRYKLGLFLYNRVCSAINEDPLQAQLDINTIRSLSMSLRKDARHPIYSFYLSATADAQQLLLPVAKGRAQDLQAALRRNQFFTKDMQHSEWLNNASAYMLYGIVDMLVRKDTDHEKLLEEATLALDKLNSPENTMSDIARAKYQFWIDYTIVKSNSSNTISDTKWNYYFTEAMDKCEYMLNILPDDFSWKGLKITLYDAYNKHYSGDKWKRERATNFNKIANFAIIYSNTHPNTKYLVELAYCGIFFSIRLNSDQNNWASVIDVANSFVQFAGPDSKRKVRHAFEPSWWKNVHSMIQAGTARLEQLISTGENSSTEARNQLKQLKALLEKSRRCGEFIKAIVDKQNADELARVTDRHKTQYGVTSSLGREYATLFGADSSYTLSGDEFKTVSRVLKKEVLAGYHILQMRASQLPFYENGRLLFIDVLKRGNHAVETKIALLSGNQPYLLSGSSEPIHKANRNYPLRLRTRNDVAAYLRFFCLYLHGDMGAFQVVESAGDLFWREGVPREIKDEISRFIRPINTWKDPKAPATWHAVATICYEGELSYAEFSIQNSGMVRMDRYNPLYKGIPVNSFKFAQGGRASHTTDGLYLDSIQNLEDDSHAPEIVSLIRIADSLEAQEDRKAQSLIEEAMALLGDASQYEIDSEDMQSTMDTYSSILKIFKNPSSKTFQKMKGIFESQVQIVSNKIDEKNDSGGLNTSTLTNLYCSLAYASLLARDTDKALSLSKKALETSKNALPAQRVYAHALLLSGHTAEAKEVYAQHMGTKLVDKRYGWGKISLSWDQFILEDFDSFTAIGLDTPEMAAIRRQLTSSL